MKSLGRALAGARITSSPRPALSLFSFFVRPPHYSNTPNSPDPPTLTHQNPSTTPPPRRARPKEIPFQAKVANAVKLIGYVSIPVRAMVCSDGMFRAGTAITQADDASSLWIPLMFEGDLAHVAIHHVRENDCIHVAGELSSDFPCLNVMEGQAPLQVMVHSFNFVRVERKSKGT